MSDSMQVKQARAAIGRLQNFEHMLTEAQRAIDSQALLVAKTLTALVDKDPTALYRADVLAWVGHWAYTGLPLHGVELPTEIMDIITYYEDPEDND